ncbi:hypothetical protein Trydic_g2517 [Trypoxylus dichotomus]
MKQIVVFSILAALGNCLTIPAEQQLPTKDKAVELAEIELEQNKNAKYAFESDIQDHINDLTQRRFEERDGLNVRGAYEYSDGYLKRRVHYIADENGFRIVKEETEPLPGPQVDLNGVASVTNKAHGTELKYTVKSVPVKDTHVIE